MTKIINTTAALTVILCGFIYIQKNVHSFVISGTDIVLLQNK